MNTQELIQEFDDIIKDKVEDLELYRSKENSSKKAIFYKDSEVKKLRSLRNLILAMTEETYITTKNTVGLIKKLNEKILRLEGICLLHGITDMHYWMTFSFLNFVELIKENTEQGLVQVPNTLRHLMPKEDEISPKDLQLINDMQRMLEKKLYEQKRAKST